MSRREAYRKAIQFAKEPISETEAILLSIVYNFDNERDKLIKSIKQSHKNTGYAGGYVFNTSTLADHKDIFIKTDKKRSLSRYDLVHKTDNNEASWLKHFDTKK